ncbi:hypothetical protein [Streptomyces sp. SLBN-8D4]|uniref:hypothetical protein n=1 Tax=Streptomyces sp. SLBN-8D4 TaxID=3377728 RepID=UPI003C7E19BA
MGDRRRRRLVAAATVVGLTFGTAACGSGSDSAGSSDPNTLEVWTRSNPDDAATYERVFAAFTRKTGIKIDYQRRSSPSTSSSRAGRPPRTCRTS